jgi:hypothetical protein
MKKNIQTLAFSVLLGGAALNAQQVHVQPCGTFDAMDQVFASDPAAKIRYDQEQDKLKKAYLAYEQSLTLHKATAFQYTVPVVFHIMHVNGLKTFQMLPVLMLWRRLTVIMLKQALTLVLLTRLMLPCTAIRILL